MKLTMPAVARPIVVVANRDTKLYTNASWITGTIATAVMAATNIPSNNLSL
ncbi:Uncharacterised protein [Staphylococcus aureus]|nr:Uncharacterised protein [Staphylococcus aureus]